MWATIHAPYGDGGYAVRVRQRGRGGWRRRASRPRVRPQAAGHGRRGRGRRHLRRAARRAVSAARAAVHARVPSCPVRASVWATCVCNTCELWGCHCEKLVCRHGHLVGCPAGHGCMSVWRGYQRHGDADGGRCVRVRAGAVCAGVAVWAVSGNALSHSRCCS